ncbi:MAG: AraC family transcriptional regulator [Haliscomenobacteraceae bacterium CHB4]|nr:HTH-type transcriptional activator RhaR [Saprospiraceae bacterium]MCE7922450.1 AraC family transcriptional regulator [Haliscomenobacteraceae bacterium CHB4]
MVLEHKTLDLFGKMLFEKAVIRPPFRRPNPMPNEACFLYILKGGVRTVSSVEYAHAEEKEALLMKCDSYYSRMLPSQITGTYEAVAVHFYPEVLKKVFSRDTPSFLHATPGRSPGNSMVKLKVDILLEKYFDSILFYFANPDLVSDELLILKLRELLLLLDNTGNAPGIREIMSNLFTPRTFSYKEIIEAHLYANLTLEELAELTKLSVSSFKREFRKIYRDSPGKYIRDKKLTKAAEMLHFTDLNISEIAFDCGFNDVTNFSVTFKEKYGNPPSIYRMTRSGKSL